MTVACTNEKVTTVINFFKTTDNLANRLKVLKSNGFIEFNTPLLDEVENEQELKKSRQAWDELNAVAEIGSIIVLATSGTFPYQIIENFATFDYWLRTNDLKNEEFWYLPAQTE